MRGELVVGDAAPVCGPAERHAPLTHAHEAGVDPLDVQPPRGEGGLYTLDGALPGDLPAVGVAPRDDADPAGPHPLAEGPQHLAERPGVRHVLAADAGHPADVSGDARGEGGPDHVAELPRDGAAGIHLHGADLYDLGGEAALSPLFGHVGELQVDDDVAVVQSAHGLPLPRVRHATLVMRQAPVSPITWTQCVHRRCPPFRQGETRSHEVTLSLAVFGEARDMTRPAPWAALPPGHGTVTRSLRCPGPSHRLRSAQAQSHDAPHLTAVASVLDDLPIGALIPAAGPVRA